MDSEWILTESGSAKAGLFDAALALLGQFRDGFRKRIWEEAAIE